MNFKPSRTFALEKLDNFIDKNLIDYSKLRNFDYGPENRTNVSGLSPYVSHGIINEIEIINKSLKKYSFVKNEKFIQEILWRVYWKGWLELRPNVWLDYLNDLKKIKENFKNNQTYLIAIDGKTNIECFNYWVNELKENNYLHNHTRMWFASIWIFTLKLPWQLGAASNTLGWRWVAGIQTKGKNYLASEWNIKKFTNNRFQNIKLNKNAVPILSEKNYSINNKDFVNVEILENQSLLVFENNLSFETTDFQDIKFKKILLIDHKNNYRTINLSESVINFKSGLLEDQKKRLEEKSINCEIININEIKNITENVYAIYPSIGENLDFVNLNGLKNIQFLYRKLDQFSWQYCNKGFFNFKNYIPKIIQKFI